MILNIPILLYHRVSEPENGSTLCVAPIDFARHMEYLYTQGYEVVSMDEITDYFSRKKRLDKKTIVLTFDDGYEDFATNAHPILKKYGFSATVFLPTDYLGKTNEWDHKYGWPKAKILSWEQIKELSNQGVSFGAHSKSHRSLVKIRSIRDLINEIKSPKKIIETALKKPVKCFSYPYGKFNKISRLFVKLNSYEFAVSAQRGINTLRTDHFCLKRIEISTHNSNIQDFIRVIKLTEQQIAPKFNILQVITCRSWGGQEMQAVYLSESLKEKGHEVIIACRKKGPVETNAQALGLKTHNVLVNASADLLALSQLMYIILKERIDIVHVHPAKDYWPAIIAAKLLRKNVIASRHLLTPLRGLTFRLLNHASRIIAVSEAVKKVLVSSGFIYPHKVSIIYNGVDINQYSPSVVSNGYRKELGIDADVPLIGCIGRMGCKGQSNILHALDKICKAFPEARGLFISEYSNPQELNGDLAKLKLEKNIIFKGFHNNIPRVLSSIDILVNVPTWEAFGLILIEAMAAGKPVVASNIGGIPEIVRHRHNGLLVSPQDPDALSDALIYLISHKKEAEAMGRHGRQLAVEKFNLINTVNNTEEVYAEAIYDFNPLRYSV